jgi:hypothetical protein
VSLEQLRSCDGDLVDAGKVPLASDTEDLLMLTDPGGKITLELPEKGYAATVEWDTNALPCCALWFSNGGREMYPWNGRISAIGIEPVASAFGFGQTHSLSSETPLADQGIATAIEVKAAAPWETSYSISLAEI